MISRHVWRYDLQYAVVVEDSVDHRDSGLGSLFVFNSERQSDRAYGEGPRVVEIAEGMIERDNVCFGCSEKWSGKGLLPSCPQSSRNAGLTLQSSSCQPN